MQDYTRALVTGQYATLNDFLSHWNSTERKQAIIDELEEQGVPVDALREAVHHEVN